MRVCSNGCGRKRYHAINGLCHACGKRLKLKGTTAYATPEERSTSARAGGLARVASQKERLGEEGYLEHMRDHQKKHLAGKRPTFEVQLVRDKAREAASEAKRKTRSR